MKFYRGCGPMRHDNVPEKMRSLIYDDEEEENKYNINTRNFSREGTTNDS